MLLLSGNHREIELAECHATHGSQLNRSKNGAVQRRLIASWYLPGALEDSLRLQEHKDIAGYCDDTDNQIQHKFGGCLAGGHDSRIAMDQK